MCWRHKYIPKQGEEESTGMQRFKQILSLMVWYIIGWNGPGIRVIGC